MEYFIHEQHQLASVADYLDSEPQFDALSDLQTAPKSTPPWLASTPSQPRPFEQVDTLVLQHLSEATDRARACSTADTHMHRRSAERIQPLQPHAQTTSMPTQAIYTILSCSILIIILCCVHRPSTTQDQPGVQQLASLDVPIIPFYDIPVEPSSTNSSTQSRKAVRSRSLVAHRSPEAYRTTAPPM